MKKIAIIIITCTVVISCNSNDTSHAGIPDTTKVSLDTPKAVVADSAKQGADSSAAKKDKIH